MLSVICLLSSVALTFAAVPEQIHISYTQQINEFAVDFVASDATAGFVSFGPSPSGPFTKVASTSFVYPTVGTMHQALMQLNGTGAGVPMYYKVGTAAGESAVFEVYPSPARGLQEKFAVFGDFGMANDECMDTLISDAKAGVYDSVLHVGDWACELISYL